MRAARERALLQPLYRMLKPRNGAEWAAVAVGLGGVIAMAWNWIRPRRMTPEEMERVRRQRLAADGRIIDGVIVDAPLYHDAEMADGPALISYRYKIAGVGYECAQEVSAFMGELAGLRVDLPVSIKYDPRNPGNSIVVAESWNGLRGSSAMVWPAQRTGTTGSAQL